MKLVYVEPMAIPDVIEIGYGRFRDDRGYFTETYRQTDFVDHPDIPLLLQGPMAQHNESYSYMSVIRGLHFQWDPSVGKLVRVVTGHMIDIALDIRLGSPTFGCAVTKDMHAQPHGNVGEWIWVPPGFAHGCLFLEDSRIEYLCTAEFAPENNEVIGIHSPDIDWSLSHDWDKEVIAGVSRNTNLMTDKDRNGMTVQDWKQDTRSRNLRYHGEE